MWQLNNDGMFDQFNAGCVFLDVILRDICYAGCVFLDVMCGRSGTSMHSSLARLFRCHMCVRSGTITHSSLARLFRCHVCVRSGTITHSSLACLFKCHVCSLWHDYAQQSGTSF